MLLDLIEPTSDRVSISRIGPKSKEKTYRVRTVLALNRPIEQLLSEKKIRPDFLHRIRTVHRLPSLKEILMRDNPKARQHLNAMVAVRAWVEIPRLKAWHETRQISQGKAVRSQQCPSPGDIPSVAELDDGGYKWILEQNWPGNYRELDRILSDAVIQGFEASPGTVPIIIDDLTLEAVNEVQLRTPVTPEDSDLSVEQLAGKALSLALRKSKGNISAASRHCGPIGMSAHQTIRKRIHSLWDFLDEDVKSFPSVKRQSP